MAKSSCERMNVVCSICYAVKRHFKSYEYKNSAASVSLLVKPHKHVSRKALLRKSLLSFKEGERKECVCPLDYRISRVDNSVIVRIAHSLAIDADGWFCYSL